MGKVVTVPLLASISVEIEDESLSERELINIAIRAAHNLKLIVDDADVEADCGEGVYVSVDEYQVYENITTGNYYHGHISGVSVEDY